MRKCIFSLVLTLCVTTGLVLIAGCPGSTSTGGNGGGADGGGTGGGADDGGSGGDPGTGGDETGGGDGGGISTLTAVNTGIAMHSDKRIEAGDDLVVFGTGGFSGVAYIIPSEGDTVARTVPGGDDFNAGSFAVSGKKVAFQMNFEVTIFDAATGESDTIPLTDVRLTNTPSGLYDGGHMAGHGGYFIGRSDTSTDDGLFVKVINANVDPPAVISFATNPATSANRVDHVMIDADSMTAVAVADGSFWIYDINDPSSAPRQIFVSAGIGDTRPQMSGDFIIFEDDNGPENVGILDLTQDAVTFFDNNPAAQTTAISAGSFAYFFDLSSEDSLGSASRSAIGVVGSLPASTLAAVGDFIDGSTTNNGAFGLCTNSGCLERRRIVVPRRKSRHWFG